MKINVKAQKCIIVGVNGSGKSVAGFHIASKQFKRFILFTPNSEDIKHAPKNAIPVVAVRMTPEELNAVFLSAKKLAQERKIDGILIDDTDSFVTGEADLQKAPALKDALVNHRHFGKKHKEDKFGLGMIFMSRRPQNVPSALFEICEHSIFFSSPTSDNIKRKYNGIDSELYEMVHKVKYKSYKFVYKALGDRPKICAPFPLTSDNRRTKSRRQTNNGKTRSEGIATDDENQSGRE